MPRRNRLVIAMLFTLLLIGVSAESSLAVLPTDDDATHHQH